MYHFKNGLAPAYLYEFVEPYKSAKMICSSPLENHKFVELLISIATGGDWDFSKTVPVLWNILPLHIRSAKSLLNVHSILTCFT